MSSGADGQVSLGPRFVNTRPNTVGQVPRGASVPTSVKNYLTADLRDTARIVENFLVIHGYDSEVHILIDFKRILDETKYSGILIKRYEPNHMNYYHFLRERSWWEPYKTGVLRAFLAVDSNMSYTWGDRAPLHARHDIVVARIAGRISTHIMNDPTRTEHTIHFNVASCMAYQPGEKIGIHRDTEKCHVDAKHPFIASISFGRSASFSNERDGRWNTITLDSGDLLLTYGDWKHTASVSDMSDAHRRFRNPPMDDPMYANGRINLTFRLFKPPSMPGNKFRGWNETTRNQKVEISAERQIEVHNDSISVTSNILTADDPAPARKRTRAPTGKCPLVPVDSGARADKKAKLAKPLADKRPLMPKPVKVRADKKAKPDKGKQTPAGKCPLVPVDPGAGAVETDEINFAKQLHIAARLRDPSFTGNINFDFAPIMTSWIDSIEASDPPDFTKLEHAYQTPLCALKAKTSKARSVLARCLMMLQNPLTTAGENITPHQMVDRFISRRTVVSPQRFKRTAVSTLEGLSSLFVGTMISEGYLDAKDQPGRQQAEQIFERYLDDCQNLRSLDRASVLSSGRLHNLQSLYRKVLVSLISLCCQRGVTQGNPTGIIWWPPMRQAYETIANIYSERVDKVEGMEGKLLELASAANFDGDGISKTLQTLCEKPRHLDWKSAQPGKTVPADKCPPATVESGDSGQDKDVICTGISQIRPPTVPLSEQVLGKLLVEKEEKLQEATQTLQEVQSELKSTKETLEAVCKKAELEAKLNATLQEQLDSVKRELKMRADAHEAMLKQLCVPCTLKTSLRTPVVDLTTMVAGVSLSPVRNNTSGQVPPGDCGVQRVGRKLNHCYEYTFAELKEAQSTHLCEPTIPSLMEWEPHFRPIPPYAPVIWEEVIRKNSRIDVRPHNFEVTSFHGMWYATTNDADWYCPADVRFDLDSKNYGRPVRQWPKQLYNVFMLVLKYIEFWVEGLSNPGIAVYERHDQHPPALSPRLISHRIFELAFYPTTQKGRVQTGEEIGYVKPEDVAAAHCKHITHRIDEVFKIDRSQVALIMEDSIPRGVNFKQVIHYHDEQHYPSWQETLAAELNRIKNARKIYPEEYSPYNNPETRRLTNPVWVPDTCTYEINCFWTALLRWRDFSHKPPSGTDRIPVWIKDGPRHRCEMRDVKRDSHRPEKPPFPRFFTWLYQPDGSFIPKWCRGPSMLVSKYLMPFLHDQAHARQVRAEEDELISGRRQALERRAESERSSAQPDSHA